MFQQILTIGRNTFVESIRQPIFIVLIMIGTIGLWLNTQLAGYTFDDDNREMINLGLSVLFVTPLLMAAFLATGVLGAEIENKTVLTVISKPVARPLFVLGKYVGVAGAITLGFWILCMTYLLQVRHQVQQATWNPIDWPVVLFSLSAFAVAAALAALGNYFYHWVFTSTFVVIYFVLNTLAWLLVLVIDKQWQFQSIVTEFVKEDIKVGQITLALVMIFEALMMLTAVAIAVSTRLGHVMTLVICLGVFLVGLFSNSVYHQFGENNIPAMLLYWVMPNLQYFWQADALTANNAISMLHLLWVTVYSLFYIAAMLCLSISLFQTREVG